MTQRVVSLVGALLLSLAIGAGRVSAAPIDIIARLNPGQTGPIYAWSLLLRVEPGYEVGAVDLLTRGFDSMEINASNPGISDLLTVYTIDPLLDGRNALIMNNVANGVAISSPGEEVLLATFYGPNRTSPPVELYDCEYECGGTAFDTYLNARPPGEVSLSAFPRALISLTVVPEPSHFLLAGLALLVIVTRALERRAVGAAPREARPLL